MSTRMPNLPTAHTSMERTSREQQFASRVDSWLVLVVGGAIAIGLAAVLKTLWAEPISGFVVIPLAVATVALPVWIFKSTRYTLNERELRIRSGPFCWKIPLSEMRSVRPSRNPLSSPALSLDRLEIRYGSNRVVLISPVDKEAFVSRLNVLRASAAHAGSSGESVRPPLGT